MTLAIIKGSISYFGRYYDVVLGLAGKCLSSDLRGGFIRLNLYSGAQLGFFFLGAFYKDFDLINFFLSFLKL
jgi:hypothetical protein